jgi:hypothetical protein
MRLEIAKNFLNLDVFFKFWVCENFYHLRSSARQDKECRGQLMLVGLWKNFWVCVGLCIAWVFYLLD